MLDRQEGTDHIAAPAILPRLDRLFEEWHVVVCGAGVGEDDFPPAKHFPCMGRHRGNIGLHGHIGDEAMRRAALRADQISGFANIFRRSPDDQHGRTLIGEAKRGTATDAATATGDDRAFAA